MPGIAASRVRHLALIGAAAVFVTGAAAILTHPFDPDRECCDHLAYRSMSYNLFTVTRPDLNVAPPGNKMFTDPRLAGVLEYIDRYGLNRTPPYVYRIFTPLLARSIAYVIGIDTAYYLVSFLGLSAAAFFIGLSILELTGSEIPAVAGVVLFAINPWTEKFNLWNYMLTDPMTFFFVALAIWGLIRRHRGLFFVACAVGALNKEALIPMVVAYPISEALVDHRVRWSSAILVVGIVAGYSLFRLLMPEASRYTIQSQFRPGLHHVKLMANAGIDVFSLTIPALLWRPWRSRLMIALAPFVVACVLEAWFVGNLERAMAPAFPAVCVGILWLWPVGSLRQVLTLLVVPLYFLRVIAGHVVGGVPYSTPILLLIAVVAEIALWRLGRGERPEPRSRVGAPHVSEQFQAS